MTKEKIISVLISIGEDILTILLIYLLGKIVIRLVNELTNRVIRQADDMEDKQRSRELKTTMSLTHSANRYIVYVVVIFLCLKQLGLGDQISSAVVAAGIGGLIVSLGLQTLIKDVIAGIFIMFEKVFLVGDMVKIGEYEGVVQAIALRVTYLNCRGKEVIIPNGDIRDLINYSRLNVTSYITIPTPYEADTAKVMELVGKVAEAYYEEHKEYFPGEKPEVLGIDAFGASSVDISIKALTLPLKQWHVQRELRLKVKEAFDKEGIEIPFTQIVVSEKNIKH